MIAALWGGGTPMVDVAQTIPHIFLDFMQMREFAKDPLVFVGGEGIRLTDAAGRRYIDGLSGVFVAQEALLGVAA